MRAPPSGCCSSLGRQGALPRARPRLPGAVPARGRARIAMAAAAAAAAGAAATAGGGGGERSSTRDRLLAALEDLELLARYRARPPVGPEWRRGSGGGVRAPGAGRARSLRRWRREEREPLKGGMRGARPGCTAGPARAHVLLLSRRSQAGSRGRGAGAAAGARPGPAHPSRRSSQGKASLRLPFAETRSASFFSHLPFSLG